MPLLKEKPSYPIAAKLTGPGPGTYMLPSAIGVEGHNVRLKRWPAYTMRTMLKTTNTYCSPGPAAHKYPSKLIHTGTVHAPKYFMGILLSDLKKDITPAPDAYDVVNHDPRRYRTPAWLMASPAPKDKINSFPAPNQYCIPKLIGTKSPYIANPACYTMRMKLDVGSFTQDLTHSPAANRYSPIPLELIKLRAPAYTMKSRQPSLHGLSVPGPATYSPNLSNRARAPVHSLGQKHSLYLAPVKVPEPDVLLNWD